MVDKQRISAKLTEEVVDYVEEYQEEMALDTRQGALEQLLRKQMREDAEEDEASLRSTNEQISSALDGSALALRLSFYFTALAAIFAYVPSLPVPEADLIGAALLIPGMVAVIVALGRLFTAVALLRAEGYGYLEMLKIGIGAHIPSEPIGGGEVEA